MDFHVTDVHPAWLALYIAAFFVGRAVFDCVRNLYFHPLSKIPGPRINAVSNIPRHMSMLSGRGPHRMKELHDVYGSIVRIAPNRLSFNSPRAFKDIYGHAAGRQPFLKSEVYNNPADPFPPTIVSERDPGRHGKIRRLTSHAFSAKALAEQEDIVAEYVDLLVKQIGAFNSNTQEMVRWFNWTTFDIIGDLAFGESFGCLRDAKSHFWVDMILDSISAVSWSSLLFRTIGNVKVTKWLVPKGLREKRIKHFQYSYEKIERRINNGASRKDFVENILAAKDEFGLDLKFLAGHSSVLIVAGSETTATCLSSVTYYLCRTPSAYEKLTKELRGAFKEYKDITALRIEALPYLNAVIDEGLRIYPPVPLGLPRISPGETVDGVFIAAGIEVSVDMWAASHAEENFRDPCEFRPERWLDADTLDRRGASQPFSLGTRGCLGRNLAMMELRMILAKVLWTYDMQLMDDMLDWVKESVANPLWRKPPLPIRYTKRAGI